jgi:carbamate kinase
VRLVVALGGNALLRRGEPLTSAVQAGNIRTAAAALAELVRDHEVIVTHGNGPQVGLLAIQDAAQPDTGNFPLDVLGAETTGMIGYPLALELRNAIEGRSVINLLTQIEVDPHDPAFADPSKPIGPVYDEETARTMARLRGWTVRRDGSGFRRVVPSPRPLRILEVEALRLLVEFGVIVICAGGGGIPIVFDDLGCGHGVEAVIDKDRSAGLVARAVEADALLMLTDVAAVEVDWGTPKARPLGRVTAGEIGRFDFASGSMGPKVEAARDFVSETGGVAGIGRLQDAGRILTGEVGTLVVADRTEAE